MNSVAKGPKEVFALLEEEKSQCGWGRGNKRNGYHEMRVQISRCLVSQSKDLDVSVDVMSLLENFKQKDGKICFTILMRLLCWLCEELTVRRVKVRLLRVSCSIP